MVLVGTVYRMMKYFTTASKKGRVRYGQISWTIGVGESDGYPMPVGQANQARKTADGLALWALRVKGADVPGGFIIVDGRFVEVEADTGRVQWSRRSKRTKNNAKAGQSRNSMVR
jgi:hypothetical protein